MITKMFEIVSEIHSYFWPFFLDLFLWNYDLKRKKKQRYLGLLESYLQIVYSMINWTRNTDTKKKNNHDVIAT